MADGQGFFSFLFYKISESSRLEYKMSERINFHEITMADQPLFDKLMTKEYLTICDYPFACNLIWSDRYHTQVAEFENCLLIRYEVEGDKMYAYPVSPDKEARIKCIQKLLAISMETNEPLQLTILTEEFKQELMHAFPGRFEIDPFRDDFDYVYKRENLEFLHGKKLSSKRNHLNRFYEQGEWCFEELTPAHFQECMDLEKKWLDGHALSEDADLIGELHAISCSFSHFEELPLEGGVIRQNGRVVAFSVGEKLNEEMFVVHFEKADADIPGSFQIINQQMAEHFGKYTYFNREDDTGNPGLRKSKLSYQPEFLVKKYVAVESDFTFAQPEDFEEIISLWQSCFSDERSYIEFFLKYMYGERTILCRRIDGEIACMACLFPASIQSGDNTKEILYLYALATHPQYRKQGLATSVITHAHLKYGCPILICPENPAIEPFYEAIGFRKVFFKDEKQVNSKIKETEFSKSRAWDENEIKSAKENESTSEIIIVNEIDTKSYFQSRRKKFSEKTFVEWEEEYLSFALKEHVYCEGKIAKAYDGYILYRIDGEKIWISESTVCEEYEERAVLELAKHYGNKTVEYEKRRGWILTADEEYKTDWENGHFALTLG